MLLKSETGEIEVFLCPHIKSIKEEKNIVANSFTGPSTSKDCTNSQVPTLSPKLVSIYFIFVTIVEVHHDQI